MDALALELRRDMEANGWPAVKSAISSHPMLVNYKYTELHAPIHLYPLKTTPLFFAVQLCIKGKCALEDVAYLLHAKADPNNSSLFEGYSRYPLFLCTTVSKQLTYLALTIGEMLIAHGACIHANHLLISTLRKMVFSPGDYDTTMIEFLCRHGTVAEQMHRGLAFLTPIDLNWVPETVTYLLSKGTSIYTINNDHYAWYPPIYLSQFYETESARLVKITDAAIKTVKALDNFERAVHHELCLDIHVMQWKRHVPLFDRIVDRLRCDERNGYLAMRHSTSTTAVLPKDIFSPVMSFVTSAKASRRVLAWPTH